MIETTILDYLSNKLDVPVYMEVPERPPKDFITLEKTGGSKRNHVVRTTIALQTWSKSLAGAASLCETAINAMEGAATMPQISAISIEGGYNFTDPTTKHYRYQAVCYVTHY